jgi:dihydroxyacetone kinase
MLSAVVCGDVFASPSSSQVFAAIKQVSSSMGVLLIVKNYTGDRLQFGKAALRARKELGIEVAMVIVDDDCSIPSSKMRGVGRCCASCLLTSFGFDDA